MFENLRDKNQISELQPAGFALFSDPESFTTELSANEQAELNGGTTHPYDKKYGGGITNIINVVVAGGFGGGYQGGS